MVDLGTLGGDGRFSYAYDINAFGQVVGQATSDDYYAPGDYYNRHAFIWENGTMVDLGTLGGMTSVAYGINDAGQVVGAATNSARYDRAFVVTPDNGVWYRDIDGDGINDLMVDLGTLGGLASAAYDINDLGQIVGWARDHRDISTPFLYSDGAMINLGSLWSVGYGSAINNSTQIIGLSVRRKGNKTLRAGTIWIDGEINAIADVVDTDIGNNFSCEANNNSGQFVSHGGWIMHPAP